MSGQSRKYSFVDPGKEWRSRVQKAKASFTDRNLDEIHADLENLVYAMALDGASMPMIADYLGVDRAEFSTMYGDVWRVGRAELQALITQNTIEYGLKSQIPVAKIWIGKAFATLGEGKSVDVESDSDDSGVNINVKVIRREETK